MSLRAKKLNLNDMWKAYRIVRMLLPEKFSEDVLLIDFIYDLIRQLHASRYFEFLEIVSGKQSEYLTKHYGPLDLVSLFVEAFERDPFRDRPLAYSVDDATCQSGH